MTRVLTALGFVACGLAPHDARADSDGYFCVGRDCLAYQFGMRCDPSLVTVDGFDAEYRVALDGNERLTGFTKAPASSLAPRWGKTVRRSLLHQLGGGEFVLEFVPDPLKPHQQCRTQVTTHILLLDSSGAVVAKRQVFRGNAYRACGEDSRRSGAQQNEQLLLASDRH